MAASGDTKVALITGGVSGMGLAVATALVKRGDWHVHLVDLNEKNGQTVVENLGSHANFHRADVTVYQDQVAAFEATLKKENRLDFVWANAGMVPRSNIYEKHPLDAPPPEPETLVLDVNLRAVFYTAYLALHYFRKSSAENKCLLMTASSAGLYGSSATAVYSASKHGVVGLLRSVSAKYFEEGIRVNALCPGPVRTGLLEKAAWDTMPQDCFTEIAFLVDTVLQVIDGNEMKDSAGTTADGGKVFGKAVELSANKFYLRGALPFCDEKMAKIMGGIKGDTI